LIPYFFLSFLSHWRPSYSRIITMESDTPEVTHQGFGIDGGGVASVLELGHGHSQRRLYIGVTTSRLPNKFGTQVFKLLRIRDRPVLIQLF
jgi:hypothetical protein